MTTKQWRLNNPEKKKAQEKRYREKHREKINAYSKQWRLNNPEKFKAKQLRYESKNPNRRRNKLYGVNISEIEEKQNRLCAICKKKKILVADHCHESNKFRGLLCNDCNLGLGRFYDSIDNLKSAIKYLRKL